VAIGSVPVQRRFSDIRQTLVQASRYAFVYKSPGDRTIKQVKYRALLPVGSTGIRKQDMMTDNLVEIRGLRFARGKRVIYDGIDLDIPRGKITAIMGPSGTGKTTLLRLIGGQLKPGAGSIRFDGVSVPGLNRDELFQLRRRMGMLFQSGALFTDLSVFENVAFPVREHLRLPESVVRALVLMKLEAVGLRGARDLMPAELSGGMLRRVALARAIVMDPALIMYDEPFTGQDPISMGVLLQLIRLLNDALGLTSVIVSHDVGEVCSIADYAYILSNGQIISHGTPQELARSSNPQVSQFMQGLPDGPVPFHYPARDYRADLLEVAS
jgi:phospholipid/cholesterol/gamma-HCH transport system ATP-binding protein